MGSVTTPSAKADGFFRICTDDDMALASCFSKFSFWTIAIDSSKGCYPLWAAYFETQLAAIKRFYTRNGLENRETSYRYQRTVFTLLSWNSKVKCYFTVYIRPLKEAVLRRYFIKFYLEEGNGDGCNVCLWKIYLFNFCQSLEHLHIGRAREGNWRHLYTWNAFHEY